MPVSLDDVLALDDLDLRLRAILPESYAGSYEAVRPESMGSAGLKYDGDGRVAWDRIWATFCDLAMAGGPPHRGTLLEPAQPGDVAAQPRQYAEIAAEICRGVALTTGLSASPDLQPGWVHVDCGGAGMAAWLIRAIVAENILARQQDDALYLPAGPHFRIGKEVKNVITSIAKTCHYWNSHMAADRKAALERLFAAATLLTPAASGEEHDNADAAIAAGIAAAANGAGLDVPALRYSGWIGVQCPDVRAAVWLMRAMIADHVLARREHTVLFLPSNPAMDAGGRRLVQAFTHACRMARAKQLL